jgi:hypothetical protein
MKNKITLLVVLIVVLAIVVRFTLWGVPIPIFCSPYYTQTYFRDIDIPNPQEFADFLEQDGWEASTSGWFDSAQGNGLVHAEKEPLAFLAKPRVSVRLFSSFKDETKGMISFFIYEGTGNRIANRMIFDDFVKKVNDNFNLNLSYDKYNYIRYCN